jgi:methylated-DNA-protein-cysteine methyltransferase-like protein
MDTPVKQQRHHPDAYPSIWQTVERIPSGKVASYGSVAALSGFPRQARLAGYALHTLPPGTDIPWHRVINAQGKISLPGPTGRLQKQLLEAEGVVFRNGKVDMRKYGWQHVDFARR